MRQQGRRLWANRILIAGYIFTVQYLILLTRSMPSSRPQRRSKRTDRRSLAFSSTVEIEARGAATC
jgi:hypothetical protein